MSNRDLWLDATRVALPSSRLNGPCNTLGSDGDVAVLGNEMEAVVSPGSQPSVGGCCRCEFGFDCKRLETAGAYREAAAVQRGGDGSFAGSQPGGCCWCVLRFGCRRLGTAGAYCGAAAVSGCGIAGADGGAAQCKCAAQWGSRDLLRCYISSSGYGRLS